MRVTTNMVMRNYQNNLNRSLTSLDSTRTRVMTKRNFNKASEDPVGAARAFQLRRDLSKTDDYLESLKNVQGELASVESSLIQIKKNCDNAFDLVQQALGGTMNDEQREIIATSLRGLQKTMLLSVNSKFGDKFLFGGSNTTEAPFELSEDGKTLKYHGLDVSDPANAEALEALTKEKLYTDIGFGIEERLAATSKYVEGSKLTVNYDGTEYEIELKKEITVVDPNNPPATTTEPLSYGTYHEAVDSINKILSSDTTLDPGILDKIKVSVGKDDNNNDIMVIDYANSVQEADKKDFEVVKGDNQYVMDILGLQPNTKLTKFDTIVNGKTPSVTYDEANMAGSSINVTYGGKEFAIELKDKIDINGVETPLKYDTYDNAVDSINKILANDPDLENLKGKITVSSIQGTNCDYISIDYAAGISDADKKDFVIKSGSNKYLMGTLGIQPGTKLTDNVAKGTAPKIAIGKNEKWEIVDSTAYDAATVGINVLGYGSKDGMSNNVILLLGEIADKLTAEPYNREDVELAQERLTKLRDNTLNSLTQLGTKSTFLEDTQKRLEDNEFNINEQIVAIENVDMAGAISEYMWAQYAYNAALKVGNSILSPSFIDFMK